MLPVVLFVSLCVVGSLGYQEPEPKVVHIPIPKAVIHHKPLKQDHHFDHHEEVPIKKTEVRRVVQKVPLIKEVPIYIYKNKPFYQPRVVPRPIVVNEVVGVPIVHDKHVIQPVYLDRPYIVEKKNFVEQPYPVHKPVPIDFVKKITKVYDRKVEVPHEVPIPLVKTVDRPVPVPYTREVVQHYDVHVNVPRPVPVKVTQHRTHVEKVPFETPNVVVQKVPVHHNVNEYIPKVPQGFDGRVLAGTHEDRVVTGEAIRFGPHTGGRVVSVREGEDHGVIGPRIAPQPQVLAQEFFDGRTGQLLRDGDAGGRGIVGSLPPVAVPGIHRGVGEPFLISSFLPGDGDGPVDGGFIGGGAFGGGADPFIDVFPGVGGHGPKKH